MNLVKKIFATLLVLTLCATCHTALGRPLTLNEIQQAACRVDGGGSGTCVKEDDRHYYILTNAHVVGSKRSVTLEFFRGGYKTDKLPGQVVWKAYSQGSAFDFALVAIDKSYFGNYPPRIIPIIPRDFQIAHDAYIASMGCPGGRWLKGWEGHNESNDGRIVHFQPPPIGGQSGSGIIVLVPDQNGQLHSRVGAVLTWRMGNQSGSDQGATGGAITINNLYDALAGRAPAFKLPIGTYQELAQQYALGDDGNIYVVHRSYEGYPEVRFPPGVYGVKIVDWNYNPSQCPDGSCPWPFGRRNPNPSPNPYGSPNPNPSPNPYGITPPDIGAPWPEPEQPKPTPEPEPKPTPSPKPDIKPTPEQEDDDVQDTPGLSTDDLIDPGDVAETDVGIWASLTNGVQSWAGGFGFASLLFMLGVVYKKYLRKRIILGVDNIQDLLEARVRKRWGKDAAERVRDVLEDVERSIMGQIDDFLTSDKKRSQVATAKLRGELANRIRNGGSHFEQDESVMMVEELGKDPNETTVPVEAAKRIVEKLRSMKR